jgi:hypothetical protein
MPPSSRGEKTALRPVEAHMNRFRPLQILAWGAAALVVFVILAVLGQPDTKGRGPAPESAFEACLRFASERLKLPANSTFSSLDRNDGESSSKLLGQHPPRFAVTAYVDSPNASGAMLRSRLTCDVTFEERTKKWNLGGLRFAESEWAAGG